MTSTQTAHWPPVVFEAPILRGLDPAARAALVAAGRLARWPAGSPIFREHETGDAFYVVVEGRVELRTVRRGDDAEVAVRVVGPSETFGEEASLLLPRRTTAAAVTDVLAAEIPAALFRRGAGRSGEHAVADREERVLKRAATADLLRTIMLTRDLPPADLEIVLDAVRDEHYERGERIYGVGEAASDVFLIADGLVQLQSEEDDRVHVRAYLARGDAFGDEEALSGLAREVGAVSMGDSRVLRLPAGVLRTVADRNAGLLGRIRRIASDREAAQLRVVGQAAANSTQHVFRDLYRMQMARSLLVIDQETCVRCGHCAWTCAATHDGTSRLVRRGDKIVTQVATLGDAARGLLLPNSCQHCKNPACMIDCPTGAIGRDPQGEVFIRESLCTGCGNCAKACPWENIAMANRPSTGSAAPFDRYPLVAVKCDLCREYNGPACVQGCPTGSILRLDPMRDVAEVAQLLAGPGAGAKGARRFRPGPWLLAVGVAAALGCGLAGFRLQAAGVWAPGYGPGLAAGWTAFVVIVALMAYAIPKRIPRVWLRRRAKQSAARRAAAGDGEQEAAPRTRMRPLMIVHVVLGVLGAAAAASHAGPRLPTSWAGALAASFWVVAALGAFGGLAYWLAPAALNRVEREGALPEDLGRRRVELFDRLYRHVSGTSDLVKTIASKVLVPYARRPLGWIGLLLSGRRLSEEQARVRSRVDAMRNGRGEGKLGGLDALIRTVVELRALPARRALTAGLRAWLPLHIIATGVLCVLLAVHVVAMVGRP